MSSIASTQPYATTHSAAPATRLQIRSGWILTALGALFLLFDTAVKLVSSKQAIDATVALGWQARQIPTLGVIELACLIIYLIPRTAPLGAILLTGYFGGAIATHLRVGNPLFSHILFPTYVAALIWGGLYLRDARVRALLLPSRSAAK